MGAKRSIAGIALGLALLVGATAGAQVTVTRTRVEWRFELPQATGNPFDYAANNVQVLVQHPAGKQTRYPAFYDGGTTWRVRVAPMLAGRYRVLAITRNGRAAKAGSPGEAAARVTAPSGKGFVRRDQRAPRAFRFSDGSPYVPIGHNVAWGSGRKGDIAGVFDKMGAVGENWSRVWMNHWDGKNLDWVMDKKTPLGQLDLDVARRWDEIVEAAERNGICIQMTLQHHGQYSSRVNSNWAENPWSQVNGGFLASPAGFFTDPRAIALTKAKYRYIVARWGYSTAVMAWELFNEVEWTDAASGAQRSDVAAWHDQMADFIRSQDPYRHLVTSSSGVGASRLGTKLDYWQPHAYRPDALSTVASIDVPKLDRPVFFGEIGPSGDLSADDGSFLRTALWGGLMSECAGAAQYWAWDLIERKGFYSLYKPATTFVSQSGLLRHGGLKSLAPQVGSSGQGPVAFGPGGGFDRADRTDFVVERSGRVEGIGSLPAFFQGLGHRDMMGPVTFRVDYPADGTFSVELSQIARAGARLAIEVDGVMAAQMDFPKAERDTGTTAGVVAKVPKGRHVVRVVNDGADWVVVRRIVLAPYAPSLAAVGKGSADCAALWVYRRGATDEPAPVDGTVALAGMTPGRYEAAWWDTLRGGRIRTDEVRVGADGALTLRTPPVARDIAVFVERKGAGGKGDGR